MKKLTFNSFTSLVVLAVLLILGRTTASAASPVVWHGSGNPAEYWAPLPDGALLAVFYEDNPGCIIRKNPDGTYWAQLSGHNATVLIYALNDQGTYYLAYEGVGNFEDNESVIYYGDGLFDYDAEGTLKLSLVAYLDDPNTDEIESGRLFISGVLHGWNWMQGNISFKPLHWDFRFHNEPYTWLLP
jgi:hypothetical protein